MKRMLSALLIAAMLCTACLPANGGAEASLGDVFTGLNDPALLPYLEDELYDGLASRIDGSRYAIEEVRAVYISQEYLDEMAFNARTNLFFGYTLDELDMRFEGTRYIFTIGDDGRTAVVPFEAYDDTLDDMLGEVVRNVAIGTGVILVCVAVSAVSAGAGAPAIYTIFSFAAEGAATCALHASLIGAVSAGIVTGLDTGDMSEALEAAVYAGSEGFKWGAVTGAVTGAIEGVNAVRRSQEFILYEGSIPTWQDSQKEAMRLYPDSRAQASFKGGVEVPYATEGSVRPDLVRVVDEHLEAIEVKNYSLDTAVNRRVMVSEIKREVAERVANLPEGSTQRIVIDVRNRGYDDDLLKSVRIRIQQSLREIYPDIPVDFLIK